MEFEAGHFRAVSLQLENDWTPVDVQLTEEFFRGLAFAAGITRHVQRSGYHV